MPRGVGNAKPSAIKLIQGTARKDREPPNEPQPAALDKLKPPLGLDRYGKQAWAEYAPILRQHGLLTVADVMLLAALCGAYSRWRRASTALHKVDPADETYRSLALTVEKAEQAMRFMGNEFGLSPASRSRVSGADESRVDPFEEWKRRAHKAG